MIPACFRENITHVDADGVKWVFRPKTGAHERQFLDVITAMKSETSNEDRYNALDKLFCEAVVSVEYGDKRATADELVSGMPTAQKMDVVTSLWMDANRLSAEEKKD